MACAEVVTAAFSFLQFVKLEGVAPIKAAVAKGVTDGQFGYTAAGSLDRSGLTAAATDVWYRRPVNPDEIDLSDGTYLIASQVASALTAHADPESLPLPIPPAGQPDGGDGSNMSTPTDVTHRIQVGCTVSKDSLFPLVRTMLTNLTDKADALTVRLQIDAASDEGFDPTWIRNAVREPFEESGATDSTLTTDP